ncbi:MAG: KamA family radical SAM protein [Oligoflexia bacterium]|nr:KamA family radical SAM protein [Oligoflexia bacterium]
MSSPSFVRSALFLKRKGYAFLKDLTEEQILAVEKKYSTLLSPYYLSLININDPHDPIAKMALPSVDELNQEGLRDPIGDLINSPVKSLTHRYKDRVLIHLTNKCPMYCRFCFRKNLMNENEANLYDKELVESFAYIKKHKEVEEVILTGGDPFLVSENKLFEVVERINTFSHVQRLRIHSRVPVTFPDRITKKFVNKIQGSFRGQVILVTHFNHPNEITEKTKEISKIVREQGILFLNQSVLLKGVNDSVETLRDLFLKLGNLGILPYYLHHCDLVQGAKHFRTTIKAGRSIWQKLRGTLPGYLLPEYILDVPNGLGKIPLGESPLKEVSADLYQGISLAKEFSYDELGD